MIGAFIQLNTDSPRAISNPVGYVIAENGCWEWVGARNNFGYAQWTRGGKYVLVHRYMYETLVGPIPDGLTLDHLCRNPPCVNPSHLEAVTHRVNMIRGINPIATNAAKKVCHNGHEFDRMERGGRYCSRCVSERKTLYYRENKAHILSVQRIRRERERALLTATTIRPAP